MRKVLLIFCNTVRRSRLIFLVSFLCGLILCYLFNVMASLTDANYGGIPVGFLAHENTVVTQELREYLIDELGMEVEESDDLEYLNTELVERHIAGIIEVPEGFQDALLKRETIPLVISFLDDYENAAFVQGYLESYTSSLSLLASGAGGDLNRLEAMLDDMRDTMIPVTTEVSDGISLKAITDQNAFRMVMGFYLMFGFLLGFATAIQLFDDRKNGSYHRVRATNVRSFEYISGLCSVGFLNTLVLIVPFFVYMAVTKPDIGIYLWQAGILCILYAMFVVGIAVVAAMYLSTKSAITAGIVGTSTIMCLLGGAYFPIDTSPEFLQKLARATPQFWFIDAIEALQENPGTEWWLNALVIALFAILCFIISGIRFVDGGKGQHFAKT